MSMALRIAFFQICTLGMLSIILSLGIFSVNVPIGLNFATASDQALKTLPNVSSYTPTTITTYVFGDFIRMLETLSFILFYTLFPLPMFTQLGITNPILNFLALMCTVVYAIAILEFVANRKVEPQ